MKVLNFNINLLAYDAEQGTTNNPLRRIADWTRRISNLPISKPKSDAITIPPGQSKVLFSGLRTTAIDGSTAFNVTLLPNGLSTYRFSKVAGTSPAFRTARGIGTDATSQITVAVDNNATVTFSASGGTLANFTPVQVGDILRISGVTTGDAVGVFNQLNEGYWVVIAKTSSSVTCLRQAGVSFSAAAEGPITLAASFATNFILYSSDNIQVGDRVQISAGFSLVTQRTLTISQVAPDFFETVSADPLPLESGIIPGASGITVYSDAKRMVYLEVDQEAAIQLNGSVTDSAKLSPFIANDDNLVASYLQVGLVYALTVVNKSTSNTLNLYMFYCE